MTHHYPSSGFTLMETMIVIAFGVCMMLALGLLMYHFNAIVTYEQTSSQSSGSATALIQNIEALVLPADAVLSSHTFSGITYNSGTTTLVLEIPAIDGSGNGIAGTFDYAAFYRTGTTAYQLIAANAASARRSGTRKLSSTVYSMTFSYNNADFTQVSTTTVDVQTQVSVKQNVISDHRTEQMRLRNH